jgi:prepilin-type N-terminal cleavage/methylation domain-containing protein
MSSTRPRTSADHLGNHPMFAPRVQRHAFSLVELIVVLIILGVICTIAVICMGAAAANSAEAALAADLARLRGAIDMFTAEHGESSPRLATFTDQLTAYSSSGGHAQPAANTGHIYGPYLRQIPNLPIGADKGKTTVVGNYQEGNGWVYNQSSGAIAANCAPAEVDSRGKRYDAY